jgi:predicted kinase
MRETTPFDIQAAIAAVKPTLAVPAAVSGRPILVMLCGLPGSGKTSLGRHLAMRWPAVVIESDRIRQTLFVPPTYTAEESRQVHWVCHTLIGWYLRHTDRDGVLCRHHVIYDATNLYEYHRELVYRLAERNGARLVVVEVTARDEVVRERLAPHGRQDMAEHYSDADWEVYQRMRQRAEPIQREHITVDTSQGGVEPAAERVLLAIGGDTERG